jgi:hypothetical protein
MASPCPECGAQRLQAHACTEDFHQMLFWESEFPAAGQVHHLMVLGYHLQHPSHYSPEALAGGLRLLGHFLEQGLGPAEVRRRQQHQLNSNQRDYKIKGGPAAHGIYDRPVRWTVTAADVVAGGPEGYAANVRRWAAAILADLRLADLLPTGPARELAR